MSPAHWSGALAVGVGWALLDARLGDNERHAHLAHQITLGLDGPIIIKATQEITVPKQAAILISAGQTHTVGPKGRLARSVYIDPRFSGVRNTPDQRPPVRLPKSVSAGLRKVSTVDEARGWALQVAGFLPGAGIDTRLSSALADAQAIASPAALARAMSLSPSRLREIVIKDFGVPPTKLLQWLQLQGAAKALEVSSSLADAAAAGGFADQAHFTRRLRQWFGVTPKLGLSGLEVVIDDSP